MTAEPAASYGLFHSSTVTGGHALTVLPSAHPAAPRWRVEPSGSALGQAVLLVTLLCWLAFALANQLPLFGLVRACAAVVLFQLLPGVLVWRALRPRDGWLLEDLTMGFAMGLTLAVPVQTIAGLMHSRIPAMVLPLAVAAVFLGVPALRERIVTARWSPVPWWLGPSLAALSLAAYVQTKAYFEQNLLYSAKPWAPHIDTYLHQALASEILTRGPVGWPTVAGEDLGYQWFAHAWIAHVTATSGVGIDQVLIRFLPALMPVLAVTCICVLGLRLSHSAVVALVTAALGLLGGQGQPWGIQSTSLPITPLSPTLGLGIPTLVALVLVLATRWRGEAQRGAVWLVPALGVIATGTKGSTSPIVIAGLALAAVAMLLWNRPMFRPVLLDTVTMIIALIATMVLVFHGSVAGLKLGVTASSQQTALAGALNGLNSRDQVLFVSATAIVAGLTRAAFAFVLPFRRSSRIDPVSWLLIGASIAGATALGIFSHPGKSQGYFTMTAIPLAAVGSAIGLKAVWEWLGPRRALTFAAIGLAAALVFARGLPLAIGPLSHRNYPHLWAIAASGAVVIALTAAFGAFVLRRGVLRGAAIGVATLGLLSGVVTYADAARSSLPVPTVPAATLKTPNAVSLGQIRAARYIRDHSGVNDLVMTNRHCTVPRKPYDGCDSRRWLVTAFSERQLLVEGWTATPRATQLAPNGRDSITINYWKPQILQLNDGFIAHPTAAAAAELWKLGVRWIYVENTRPHASDLAPYATLGLRTPDASAWRLNPPQ